MDSIEADVIVIGSGVAGAMTAWSLAGKGAKVVILEAGPRIRRADIVRKFTQSHKFDFSSGFPNEDWAPRPDWQGGGEPYFEQTGPQKSNIEYLRVVGGTTWHWDGSCSRLLPVDMRLKRAYGVGHDWPFDYAALEPFYCRAEKEMGVAGGGNAEPGSPRSRPYPLPPVPLSYSDKIVAAGLEKIGIAPAPQPAARNTLAYDGRSRCMGFGTCSPICPSGAQYGGMVHVQKAEKLGVAVLENTRVDRIVADHAGRITAAHAKKPDGTEVTARGRIFVLAANGIETSRLLLMSASESLPKGLANGSGRVGRNFFDHPGLIMRLRMPKPVYPRGPHETMGSGTFRDGPFRKERSAWAIKVLSRPYAHETANEALQEGLEPPALDAAIRDRVSRHVDITSQMEQLPRPENGIALDWTRRDRAGQPLMRFHYSFSDYERAAFTECRKVFRRIAAALGAETVSVNGPWSHHHPQGMAMMGEEAKTSVVDPWCRSHDHPNLFLTGSAVFPSCGTVSPTLTIAAVALRTAEEIARQLKS